MKLEFKKWFEIASQGGGPLPKEQIPLTALNIAGYGSSEKPPTKANGYRMKKK